MTALNPQVPVCDHAAPDNVRIPEEPDLSACPSPPERFAEMWQPRIEDLGCPVAGTGQPVTERPVQKAICEVESAYARSPRANRCLSSV